MARRTKPRVTVSPVYVDPHRRASDCWTFTVSGDGQVCGPHFHREDQAVSARQTFVRLAREGGRRVVTGRTGRSS